METVPNIGRPGGHGDAILQHTKAIWCMDVHETKYQLLQLRREETPVLEKEAGPVFPAMGLGRKPASPDQARF